MRGGLKEQTGGGEPHKELRIGEKREYDSVGLKYVRAFKMGAESRKTQTRCLFQVTNI